MKSVYLDHASTSPLDMDVFACIRNYLLPFQNPSSYYKAGAYNKSVIETVREKVAKEINAEPNEIIFTSSGSEANALGIDGFLKANTDYKCCYCSNIEHSSIYKNKNCKPLIKSDKNGYISIDEIKFDNSFYSIMMCNNELGTYQPIRELTQEIHKRNGMIHVDAVQAFGKIPIDVKDIDIDLMSLSGHKIGALRGVGVLYIKNGINVSPIIYGEQENGIRGGTYNDLAIKSLGFAIDNIDYKKDSILRSRRDYLLDKLLQNERIHLNGWRESRNSTNINIRIDGLSISSQQLVGLLDEAGYMVSSGSACNSYNDEPSHVLKAIGLTDEEAKSSIRITIGYENSVDDLVGFSKELFRIIKMFKK